MTEATMQVSAPLGLTDQQMVETLTNHFTEIRLSRSQGPIFTSTMSRGLAQTELGIALNAGGRLQSTAAETLARSVLYGCGDDEFTGWTRQAGLDATNMRAAELGSASLVAANLAGMDFTDAQLWHATLVGANLSGANLTRADLGRARCNGADLRGATLTDAVLDGCSLERADLRGVDVAAAKCGGVKLRHAQADESSVLPSGWKAVDGLVVRDGQR